MDPSRMEPGGTGTERIRRHSMPGEAVVRRDREGRDGGGGEAIEEEKKLAAARLVHLGRGAMVRMEVENARIVERRLTGCSADRRPSRWRARKGGREEKLELESEGSSSSASSPRSSSCFFPFLSMGRGGGGGTQGEWRRGAGGDDGGGNGEGEEDRKGEGCGCHLCSLLVACGEKGRNGERREEERGGEGRLGEERKTEMYPEAVVLALAPGRSQPFPHNRTDEESGSTKWPGLGPAFVCRDVNMMLLFERAL